MLSKKFTTVRMLSNTPSLPVVVERASEMEVLIVDDDAASRMAISDIARNQGFAVASVDNLAAGRETLKSRLPDILLLDLKLPGGGGGLTLLEKARALCPDTVVVVMTAYPTVSSAVEAMRMGANEYLTKPFTMDALSDVLERGRERCLFESASRRIRDRLPTVEGLGTLIGSGPEMERVYRILSKVAHTRHPVLIVGEDGTGKEIVARTIHSNGPNSSQPFVTVDCSSLDPTMLEGELFGYVKGAIPGAAILNGRCRGRFPRIALA